MKQEFINDMGKNPLGSGQKVRQIGDYILEYYKDSFSIPPEKVNPRLQLYRKAKDSENHYRKWKQISQFEDYDGDLWELFNNVTLSELQELEN